MQGGRHGHTSTQGRQSWIDRLSYRNPVQVIVHVYIHVQVVVHRSLINNVAAKPLHDSDVRDLVAKQIGAPVAIAIAIASLL